MGAPDSFSPPSLDEHTRFLISFLFAGEVDPGVVACVARAYRDFSRTAHGITKGSGGPHLKRSAHRLVETLLEEAIHPASPWQTDSFDAWHRRASERICEHYRLGGYANLCVGQAQKWLNMAIKYALSLAAIGYIAVDHVQRLRTVAHVPLDDYILTALAAYDGPPLPCAWSQINDYALYSDLQSWIRRKWPTNAPLDVEFHMWIKEAARRRQSASV